MLRTTRRRLLSALGASLSILAGCTQFDVESGAETGQSDGSGSEATAAATVSETDTATVTTSGPLPARRPMARNSTCGRPSSSALRSVTRTAATTASTSHAIRRRRRGRLRELVAGRNRDGRRLGRRDLLHAHSTAPFTRSATITIPVTWAVSWSGGTTRPTSTVGRR